MWVLRVIHGFVIRLHMFKLNVLYELFLFYGIDTNPTHLLIILRRGDES